MGIHVWRKSWDKEAKRGGSQAGFHKHRGILGLMYFDYRTRECQIVGGKGIEVWRGLAAAGLCEGSAMRRVGGRSRAKERGIEGGKGDCVPVGLVMPHGFSQTDQSSR